MKRGLKQRDGFDNAGGDMYSWTTKNDIHAGNDRGAIRDIQDVGTIYDGQYMYYLELIVAIFRHST